MYYLILFLLFAIRCIFAADHTVGGSKGWSSGVNYTEWAANETFAVGDSLTFLFNSTQYDVVEVSGDGYESCSTTDTTYKNGNMSFILEEAKTYYYISSGTSCSASGMKLAVTSGALCKATFILTPSSASASASASGASSPTVAITLASLCGAIAFILALVLAYMCIKWKPQNRKGDAYNWDPNLKATLVRPFGYADLYAATRGFDEAELLGQGGFGKVYRGVLIPERSKIAVKVMENANEQSHEQFMSEIMMIGQVRHKNLASLRGWCQERHKLILVYDYMENRSLDHHLFSPNNFLPWTDRYTIVKGIAEGLNYLHAGCPQRIVHRDIKAANVLLDSRLVAHLGDFGLARLMDESKVQQTMTHAGTWGYIAPELALLGKANEKSDVFSFGVLLLEIACGKRALDNSLATESNDNISLVEWVWDTQQAGGLLEVVDPRLTTYYNEKEMVVVLSLGLLCSHPDADQRPSSRTCCLILNGEAPLPDLPHSKPIISLRAANSELCVGTSGTAPSTSNASKVSFSSSNPSSKYSSTHKTSYASPLLQRDSDAIN